MIEPVRFCTSRERRRRRRLKYRMMLATTGRITVVISVSRQLLQSRYAMLAAMVMVERMAVTTVPDAADAS